MATLSPQDIKTLEQTRQRLSQLHNSLISLQQQLINSDPLPLWPSLHSFSQIISQNLASVSSHLSTHSPLLSSLAAYPLPNYPGREQENILHQLLRKKLEPHVEDWVEEGRAAGEGLAAQGRKDNIREFWEWAGMAANEQARKHEWGGEYILEEIEGGIENVVTGLKRGMGEESEDEDEENQEEGGEAGKEVAKAMPLEDMLRFMAKGEEVKRDEANK
ncbi:mediator of RNA polymerase II transcription subunit 8 [Lecanora helva]